jgi:cell division protein FtsL
MQVFLNAETTEARNLLSGFSFAMLEKYTNQYMSAPNMKNIKEARKLWLVEEYYKRKADKVASERLFYVFLAVTLLMLLILVLTFRIYQMQKKLQEQE